MASNPQSQHRCVFVGNIPYDATEEQLVQICEEVGPVVSFRLVTDRDTGKPKGYGFCEYKDEETALSARRNLQGYEINGRQLRVDFAENDKNAERNREQGRGGPGVPSNVDSTADPLKQLGGLAGQSSLHQQMGDSAAMAAATVMAGALGSGQVAFTLNQIGPQTQPMLGTDPLTRHLAQFSRSQLIEAMSALKAMATQNKEQARQLLHGIPTLPKALLQAQIMLGMVSPQMLQVPNIRQASAAQPVQLGLPPLPQNKIQSGLLPYAQENQVLPGALNQHAAIQQHLPQFQRPQLVQNQILPNLGYDHPQLPASGFQKSVSSTPFTILENLDSRGRVSNVIGQSRDQVDRASKMVKLDGRQAIPSEKVATPFPAGQLPRAEEILNSEKHTSQLQVPTDVDPALLQQVLSLTPEQLSSLPLDQQQQLIQLQHMLRQAT